MPLETGLTATVEHEVGPADLATVLGSGTVEVLGTPRVLAWMEAACLDAIDGHLSPGETTVGTHTEFDHVRPSVIGATVRCAATLERVDGRRLTFTVTAADADADEEIAVGRLGRVIVDTERFVAAARAHPTTSQ